MKSFALPGSIFCGCVLLVVVQVTMCSGAITKSADKSPRIVMPKTGTIPVRLGNNFNISCVAEPRFADKSFSIIYWLVNNTFIETTYPHGRVKEGTERSYTENGKYYIMRSLTFAKVTQPDLNCNFTCVVITPAGQDSKIVVLGSELKLKT
ncbi:interleukin-1 receptor type 2-like [Erpetoichthys calabaricus]|uniref:interleukin-1 receptor type 2-like n=1 Tax=Erpetoichthys calabaricus TaxID=27687 RepID=UPI0010A00CF7|nr:interleukin-1 receptor type 2-like [Erpetoichthys calabaricus]